VRKSRAIPKSKQKPKGGRRPGAGRPEGANNALPLGAVAAIKAGNLRVPDSATPAERELAALALVRTVDVMMERVSSFSMHGVLTASRTIREEICGKVAEKHEVDVRVSLEDLIYEAVPDEAKR
jgi:hypothetical protein